MRCDVSIIVPTYNEEKDIQTCLESLRSQKTRVSYEIIVSDSKSNDATCDIAREFADKIVIISERGIGTGRNAGAMQAMGEHLLFVDADTMLPKTYVEEAHGKFSDTRLLGFSGRFKFYPRNKKGRFAENFMDVYYRMRPVLVGFNTNVRKSAFEKVGGYRDMPVEDVDFGVRVSKVGKIRYTPDLQVSTSARRLEKMGLLGTAFYYVMLDFKRAYPNVGDFMVGRDYVPVHLERGKKVRYREVIFDSRVNNYITHKTSELKDVMADLKITRMQMRKKIKSTVKSLSYISFTPRRPEEYVDRAIELLKEKYRRRG